MKDPEIQGLSEWKPLARGPFAAVWQARQLSLDRLVAVKVYERALEESAQRRFFEAAAEVGRLPHHPGIVTIRDAGLLSDGRPYVVSDLCPRGSWASWLKGENWPGAEQVRRMSVLIADALAAAHASGVLHRDIKPANVLFDQFGNPRLADFGFTSIGGLKPERAEALPGNPEYAPPEAFETRPATKPGDVYSLAATLCALLAGQPPRTLSVDSVPAEQRTVISRRPVAPLPAVNRPLMGALIAALSDDPAARPTAAGFRDQLAGAAPERSRRPAPHVGATDGRSSSPEPEPSPVPVRPTASRPEPPPSPAPVHAAASGASSAALGGATADPPRTLGPAPSEVRPRRSGSRRIAIALAAVLIIVITSAMAWLLSRPAPSGSSPTLTGEATPVSRASSAGAPAASVPAATLPTPDGEGTGAGPRQADAMELEPPVDSAEPFETVRIQGIYPAGANSYLRVQRWEGGKWLAFPLPTKADQSGRFTAHVEFGEPGRYRLRVVDPSSGVKSGPFVLVIKH